MGPPIPFFAWSEPEPCLTSEIKLKEDIIDEEEEELILNNKQKDYAGDLLSIVTPYGAPGKKLSICPPALASYSINNKYILFLGSCCTIQLHKDSILYYSLFIPSRSLLYIGDIGDDFKFSIANRSVDKDNNFNDIKRGENIYTLIFH